MFRHHKLLLAKDKRRQDSSLHLHDTIRGLSLSYAATDDASCLQGIPASAHLSMGLQPDIILLTERERGTG